MNVHGRFLPEWFNRIHTWQISYPGRSRTSGKYLLCLPMTPPIPSRNGVSGTPRGGSPANEVHDALCSTLNVIG